MYPNHASCFDYCQPTSLHNESSSSINKQKPIFSKKKFLLPAQMFFCAEKKCSVCVLNQDLCHVTRRNPEPLTTGPLAGLHPRQLFDGPADDGTSLSNFRKFQAKCRDCDLTLGPNLATHYGTLPTSLQPEFQGS